MIILYTAKEGGEWIPFETPYLENEIRAMIDENNSGIVLSSPGDPTTTTYVPINNKLPTFYSILMPTAARWDVVSKKWMAYVGGEDFRNFWPQYISAYKQFELGEKREHWWMDQGPGSIEIQ